MNFIQFKKCPYFIGVSEIIESLHTELSTGFVGNL